MCQSCQELMINGVRCHEIGCPDAWRDLTRACENCGCDFIPEDSYQDFCDEDCAACFYGWDSLADSLDPDDAEDDGSADDWDGEECCECGSTDCVESSYCGSFCPTCFEDHYRQCGICGDDQKKIAGEELAFDDIRIE